MNALRPVCHDCRRERLCAGRRDMARETVLAWAHNRPKPDCASFEPRWFRGLEGVADHSPRPSMA